MKKANENGNVAGLLAMLLAVLSVLAVVGTSVAAVAVFASEDGEPAAKGPDKSASTESTESPTESDPTESEPTESTTTESTKDTFFDGGQALFGDRRENATFEVPSEDEGFELKPGVIVGFEGPLKKGSFVPEELKTVGDPAEYLPSACKDGDSTYNRGFTGLGTVYPGSWPVKEASADLAKEWVHVASYTDDNKKHDPSTPLKTRKLALNDGSSGYWTSSVITMSSKNKCASPELEINVLAVDTGKYVANVVLVRDLGVDDEMSDKLVQQILKTARKQK